MKTEIIKKDKSRLKIAPNLEDYEKTYKTFDPKEAAKQIDFKDGKLNAAYNAIERNALNWRKNKWQCPPLTCWTAAGTRMQRQSNEKTTTVHTNNWCV